jgi:DMSO/TMAO reductase YedYZ molybdopterin-dependent catalytic subunit
MKKTTTILAITTTIIVILAAFASMYYTEIIGNNLQSNINHTLPAGQPPQWQIKVTGDVDQEKSFTLDEISKMPLTNVIVKNENATYCGVTLIEFCSRTGVLWDAGSLKIISANGESATLSIFDAWNSTYYPYDYDFNVIVLAFIKNGQWMTNQTGGPAKLIAPDFASNYQVDRVEEIHSEPWAVSITGDVANPLVITGKNLTDFQSQTLRGEFKPGDESNRTSDWTGLPILDVLQSAKVSDQAKQVCVIGIDGYEQNFTLDQVRDGKMMIGYEENEKPLPASQGGPFRLFAPTSEYKWGQYWVKFVVEINVF